MTSSYEYLPVPGQTVGPSYTDPELLKSSVAGSYTKRGVTLAGGQGILPIGTVLGQNSSNKKYYVYNNSGSNDIDVARCILTQTKDTEVNSGADQQANVYTRGVLKNSLVSGADSNAITDLKARRDLVTDEFYF